MSRHQLDLVMCLKQPGTFIGKVCDRCDGRCPTCDSYVRPKYKVRICQECAFGANANRCVICGQYGNNDAHYCWECCRLEKNRDGCPKIVNVGSNKLNKHYERKPMDAGF
ncbi:LAMI_0D09736g1_1 [Lachancea mirantina]|uniref:LAMI_0D09736g1_1 n=1 Tax=Lachancea mirantina TaxID=1230905 RepID=A0A1G4JDP8_9SACH|nr:LAMI_0D09736g1_1 [Lachancea mirantina]